MASGPQDSFDTQAAQDRSYTRVYNHIGPDSHLTDTEREAILCPFCEREMVVRFSILGRLDDHPQFDRPHIDGVKLKCAGDDGCGFRPDFDVPISSNEWVAERERRNGERVLDAGYTPDSEGKSLEDRLVELGYIER